MARTVPVEVRIADLEPVKKMLVAAGEEIGRLLDCLQDIEGIVRTYDVDPSVRALILDRIGQVLAYPVGEPSGGPRRDGAVTCQRCQRIYVPTPRDDFYENAWCFECLLAEKAPDLVGKPHLVVVADRPSTDDSEDAT